MRLEIILLYLQLYFSTHKYGAKLFNNWDFPTSHNVQHSFCEYQDVSRPLYCTESAVCWWAHVCDCMKILQTGERRREREKGRELISHFVLGGNEQQQQHQICCCKCCCCGVQQVVVVVAVTVVVVVDQLTWARAAAAAVAVVGPARPSLSLSCVSMLSSRVIDSCVTYREERRAQCVLRTCVVRE